MHAAQPGNLPDTYFNKLDTFFKPKQNALMAVREVCTNFQQGGGELNSWIARITNAIQLCNYHQPDLNILLTVCNSQKAKTRMMKEGEEITLDKVKNIPQEERQATIFKAKPVHYVKYDAKKGKNGKKLSHKTKSHMKKPDSNGKKCFRCGETYSKGHMDNCEAKNIMCRHCHKTGHYQTMYRKAGNFPKFQECFEGSCPRESFHSSTILQ